MNVLEILDPGLLATIQDRGRFGYEAEGVPRSGAADSIGLAVANLLLGNSPDAAAIEGTVLGPRVRALVDLVVALGGADLGARVEGTGRELASSTSHRLRAGDVIAFRGTAADGDGGCRMYLAVPGGVDVPSVLGSRSTCLPAGFGGFEGRALRAGDRVSAPASGVGTRSAARIPADLAAALPSPAQRIRVLPGPASGAGDPARAGLVDRPWIVDPASDRRGLRLEPADRAGSGAAGLVPLAPLAAGELPSHGVVPGAIQVTPSGQPLVLMPDAGTTGGYPVVAVVIHADLPLLGQLAPGAEVRFREIGFEAARVAELERRAALEALAERLDLARSS